MSCLAVCHSEIGILYSLQSRSKVGSPSFLYRISRRLTADAERLLFPKQGPEYVKSTTMKSLRALALFGAGVSGTLSIASISSCDESEHGLDVPC